MGIIIILFIIAGFAIRLFGILGVTILITVLYGYWHLWKKTKLSTSKKILVSLLPIIIISVLYLPALFASNLNNEGYFLLNSSRYEEAIEYWNMLIEMMPEMSVAWNGKAKAEYEMGDIDRAIKHATAAIYCNPQAAAFRSNRGQMLLQVGRYKEGFADFEEAVKLGAKPSKKYESWANSEIG